MRLWNPLGGMQRTLALAPGHRGTGRLELGFVRIGYGARVKVRVRVRVRVGFEV